MINTSSLNSSIQQTPTPISTAPSNIYFGKYIAVKNTHHHFDYQPRENQPTPRMPFITGAWRSYLSQHVSSYEIETKQTFSSENLKLLSARETLVLFHRTALTIESTQNSLKKQDLLLGLMMMKQECEAHANAKVCCCAASKTLDQKINALLFKHYFVIEKMKKKSETENATAAERAAVTAEAAIAAIAATAETLSKDTTDYFNLIKFEFSNLNKYRNLSEAGIITSPSLQPFIPFFIIAENYLSHKEPEKIASLTHLFLTEFTCMLPLLIKNITHNEVSGSNSILLIDHIIDLNKEMHNKVPYFLDNSILLPKVNAIHQQLIQIIQQKSPRPRSNVETRGREIEETRL